MKKTIFTIAAISALIFSCSPKEKPSETKEEKESREKIQRLRKTSDSLDRSADSIHQAHLQLEKFYNGAIRLTNAGLSENQAIEKMKKIDSIGYSIYIKNKQQNK